MIFVMVGTHTVGFDRLIRAVDEWASTSGEEVVAQIGAGAFEPRHCRWFRYTPPGEIDRLIAEARVVVSHSGAGSLLGALGAGRAVITVPRRVQFGELHDDHQVELADALAEAGLAVAVRDLSDLPGALATTSVMPSRDDSGRATLVSAVRAALDRWCPTP